jgi:hypothetical protein
LGSGGFLAEGFAENAVSSTTIEVLVVTTIETAISEKVQAGFFHPSWFVICQMFPCAEFSEIFTRFWQLFAPKLYS